MKAPYFAACLLVCALVGCEEKPKAGPTTTAPTTTTPVTPTTSAVASAGNPSDGEGIPTEEDFEDEAEQKITSQNANEELDKLEREISN